MSDLLTRRAFLQGILTGSASLAAGCSGLGFFSSKDNDIARSLEILAKIEAAEGKEELPNIVLILTDDLGYGDIGCFGSQAISTPHIDRMAREGARLTSFYASAPVCTPSRAGLLSGRYPIRTHMNDALLTTKSLMGTGHRLWGLTSYGIPQDELLLPEMLKQKGYQTALIGKWHLGDFSPHLPNENGFDFFFGPLKSNDIKPFAIYRNSEIIEPAPADQDHLTMKYTQNAIRFITQNKDRPFFLYFAHTFPHIPLHASQKFRGTSAGGLYGDTVEEVDWSVGEILKTLKELMLDEKTIVIFTSDNGPWYQGSPGCVRGRKRHVFEGGFRVPFIARWPGRIPFEHVSDRISMNFDLYATCLNLAHVPLPSDRIIDGKDIMPMLTGDAPSPHDTLYFYWRNNLWAIRCNEWKYHRRHEVGDINPNPWPHNEFRGPYLFNLKTDPSESYSMIDTNPDIARKLSGMMDDWETRIADNVRGWK